MIIHEEKREKFMFLPTDDFNVDFVYKNRYIANIHAISIDLLTKNSKQGIAGSFIMKEKDVISLYEIQDKANCCWDNKNRSGLNIVIKHKHDKTKIMYMDDIVIIEDGTRTETNDLTIAETNDLTQFTYVAMELINNGIV